MASRQRSSGRAGSKPARAIKPHADKAAALLKALANEQRLMILCNLLEGFGERQAGIAPRRPEVDDNQLVLLNGFLEIGFGKFDDGHDAIPG